MIAHAVTPLLLIVFLGLVLRRIGFLGLRFIDAAIELIYRTALPVLVLSGVIQNADSPLFIWSYWGLLLSAPLILFGFVYLFLMLSKKIYFLQKVNLKVFVKIVFPLCLSLVGFMFDPTIMGNICVLTIVIAPALDLALKHRPSSFSIKEVDVSYGAKLWVRDIILHPVVIAGLLGLFFLDGNDLLISFVGKITDILVPALLPLCLIVTGAKLGQL